MVVLHGFTGNRLPELAGFVPWLQQRHNVLQFDFRGHGASDGETVTMGAREHADIEAAVDYLRGRGLDRIALFGVSMGAAVAILAAPDLPVAAVVADAAYARVSHPVASRTARSGLAAARARGAGNRGRCRACGRVRLCRIRWRRSRASRPGRCSSSLPPAIGSSAGARASPCSRPPASRRSCTWSRARLTADSYIADPDVYQERVLSFLERHLEAA